MPELFVPFVPKMTSGVSPRDILVCKYRVNFLSSSVISQGNFVPISMYRDFNCSGVIVVKSVVVVVGVVAGGVHITGVSLVAIVGLVTQLAPSYTQVVCTQFLVPVTVFQFTVVLNHG